MWYGVTNIFTMITWFYSALDVFYKRQPNHMTLQNFYIIFLFLVWSSDRAPDESSQLGPSHESSRVESSRAESENFGLVTWPESDVTWLVDSRVRLRKSKPQKSAKTYKKETKRTLVTFLYQNIKKKSLSLFAITSRSPCWKVRWLRS